MKAKIIFSLLFLIILSGSCSNNNKTKIFSPNNSISSLSNDNRASFKKDIKKEETILNKGIPYEELVIICDNEVEIDYLPITFKYMLSSELRLLRNEIFARKGYIFKSNDLKEYFKAKSWYTPKYTAIDSIKLDGEIKITIDSIIFYEKANKDLTVSDLKKIFNIILETGQGIPPIVLANRFIPQEANLSYLYHNLFVCYKLGNLSDTSKSVIFSGYSYCTDNSCFIDGYLITYNNNLDYIDYLRTNGEEVNYTLKNNTVIISNTEFSRDDNSDTILVDKNGYFIR